MLAYASRFDEPTESRLLNKGHVVRFGEQGTIDDDRSRCTQSAGKADGHGRGLVPAKDRAPHRAPQAWRPNVCPAAGRQQVLDDRGALVADGHFATAYPGRAHSQAFELPARGNLLGREIGDQIQPLVVVGGSLAANLFNSPANSVQAAARRHPACDLACQRRERLERTTSEDCGTRQSRIFGLERFDLRRAVDHSSPATRWPAPGGA